MNILITGIHGFVGNNLVTAFSKQHPIYGLDIVSPQKDGILSTFRWNELDSIPPVEVIIHLAGKAHDTKNTSSDQEYFDINVGLTQKIFKYFLKSSATKFILFSSVKAVADSVIGERLLEGEIPNPQTPYGKSKQEAERYIFNELETWQGSDNSRGRLGVLQQAQQPVEKKVYILRPCMIHGPGNKGNLNLLYILVQKGLPWPLGAFDNKRSFCSIDNVSFAVQQLIEKNIESGVYQIADDEALSTNELIGLIAASQNKSVKIWNISVKLMNAIARIGDFLHLPLNGERLKKLTESYVVSNVKIKQALLISKMPVSAKAGMKKTLDSFKQI